MLIYATHQIGHNVINTHNTSNGINMVENNESSVVNDAKTL